MEKNLMVFSSMTAVMKARELLRRSGIRSATVRTPASLRRGSCGYSLRVPYRYERAAELLREKNIPFVGASAVDDR
ncbi:MAG: DUF3343 domain-containing protein [Ruminococcus sp.]